MDGNLEEEKKNHGLIEKDLSCDIIYCASSLNL